MYHDLLRKALYEVGEAERALRNASAQAETYLHNNGYHADSARFANFRNTVEKAYSQLHEDFMDAYPEEN